MSYRIFFTILACCTTILVSGCTSLFQSGGNAAGVNMPRLIPYNPDSQIQERRLSPISNKTANNNTNSDDHNDFVNNFSAKKIAGVWQANIGGMKCQISTPRTIFGKGYRLSMMSCPISIASARYWKVENGALLFFNRSDQLLATLYPKADATLEGKIGNHDIIRLSRN